MGKKKKFKGVSKLNKQKPSNANTTLNEHFGIAQSSDIHIGDLRNPKIKVVDMITGLVNEPPSEETRALFEKTREFAKERLGPEPGSKFGIALNTIHPKEKEEGFNMNLRSPYDRTLSNLPSADFDMDILQGERMLSPNILRLPGISKFLTSAQIEELHKGEFVQSGGFEKGMTLSKQDPFFYAVRGEPGGTVIANSKGSVLIPGIRIPLGSKFDYRL